MKSFLKNLFIQILILITLGVSYAAWNDVINSGDPLTATAWNDLVTYIASLDATPTGAVMAFNLSSCPTGWSSADGTNGNPDLRGSFVRGMNGAQNGRDTARILGDYQADSFQSHTHTTVQMIGNNNIDGVDSTTTHSGEHHNEVRNTGSSGGTETRPKNIALLYCIKD